MPAPATTPGLRSDVPIAPPPAVTPSPVAAPSSAAATPPPAATPYLPYAYPAYSPQYGYPPAAYAGYPNGRQPGYQAYAPYYYPYYAYPYPYPPKPRPAKGEGYRLALGWITTIGSALLLLGGLAVTALLLRATLRGAQFSLAALASTTGLGIGALAGGAGSLYFGIRALLKQPSARFSLPPAWVWLLATLAAFGGEIVLWNLQPTPGPVLTILPLFILAGALPAGTILAFAAQRLDYPSTWRHMLVSLVYGAVVATLVAGIFEGVLFIVLVAILLRLGIQVPFGENFLQSFDPSDPLQVLMFVLVASVIAPVIEESFKPLGAVFLLPRVRGPSEAFLLGLAAGEGFAVIETLTYFGLGQADWISVAIDRIGAGLLHGVGAGMGALGWYYLVRGKGISRRWLLGFGALGYAVLQHGIFNASELVTRVPLIGPWLNSTTPLASLGSLPIERSFLVELVMYALVLAMLVFVTGRLRRAPQTPATSSAPAAEARGPELALTAGGAR
jgi:RsiW-degrading membrane proteinase PrsW (M82 family)